MRRQRRISLRFFLSGIPLLLMPLWVTSQAESRVHVDTNIHKINSYPNWVVYYSDQAKPRDFDAYQLLVLDSHYHPNLQELKERGKTLLGYISLGEVEQHRPWFKKVKKEGILLKENRHWKGSFYVDLRDKRWTKRVIEELVPRLLRKGFDGLFLDTLDNPGDLERDDPKRYAGMVQAGVNLVKTLRRHYPDMPIMMNRGYELLPQVAKDINMELGESVYADYDFETGRNGYVEEAVYREQVTGLQQAQKINPHLAVYTLDYWDPEDKEGIAGIYAEQRRNGFLPYVSTIELDQLVTGPDQEQE